MATNSIRVVVRTRPTNTFAEDYITVHPDKRSISVRIPEGATHSENAKGSWSWKYDMVLHNASQETVYSDAVEPVIRSILQGYNGSILCYGQTGSGKTFTQIGSTASYAHRGIAPRVLAEIFRHVQEHPQYDTTIGVSYVEIYNDSLVDLLSTIPSEQQQTEQLTIAEDSSGNTHVKGLRVEQVRDEEEALKFMFEGESNRSVAKHQLNSRSTRGHAIFTIFLQIRSRVESSDKVTRCRLNLVDLAGSERLKKTETAGELRSESMYINQSLSYLEQVVVALASRSRSHTPYRQSKLTHLLKDSLGGNSKTLLIANIYGEQTHIEETVSTLQFAARVKVVTNKASVNEIPDPSLLLKKYEAQITELKRELAMHDSLSNRSRVAYEPYSEAQRAQLTEELQAYLEHTSEEVNLESVRHMRELLLAARTLFAQKQAQMDELQRAIASGSMRAAGEGEGAHSFANSLAADADAMVGQLSLKQSGFSVGTAADGAKPPGGLLDPPHTKSAFGNSIFASDGASGGGEGEEARQEAPVGQQDAFNQFKASKGAELNARLIDAKKALKENRHLRNELAVSVNQAKKEIDQHKLVLEQKKVERASNSTANDEAEIIDEEEYAYIQALKEAKMRYKQHHDELLAAGEAMEKSSAEVSSLRQALVGDFNVWYAEMYGTAASDPPPRPEVDQDSAGAGEVLDEDERFDRMRMDRVMAVEPESLAFVRASKAAQKKGGKRRM